MIHILVNIIQTMFCNVPYFWYRYQIACHPLYLCESYFVWYCFVGHVIWREERRSRQKSRAFSYFACVDVSWRQSGRSGWYGLQVLTCDAHNKRWWRWLYFLLTTWESKLRFFWNIFSCLKRISLKIFIWKYIQKILHKKFQFLELYSVYPHIRYIF